MGSGPTNGKTRVVIGTTQGPVDVLLMTEEDTSFGRSVVCIDGTTQTADIDRDYDLFVKPLTGVVARLFGHDCFRVDVSANISAGLSWQLGLLVAHGLYAACRLAQDDAAYDCLHWATGTVRSRGLAVGDVRHLREKLIASLPRLRSARIAGQRVIVSLPASNAAEIDGGITAELRELGIEVTLVETADAALSLHGLTVAARMRSPTRQNEAASAGQVPTATTRLIGRAVQQTEIADRLRGSRLVSIVGPGGVGKTRVAAAVAAQLSDAEPHSVWFVDLSNTRDQGGLDETVCAALGVGSAEPGRPARDGLKTLLRHRRALVVLDNCEQIVDAVAGFAAELLASCPDVRILATSREALRVNGEAVVQLPPLALPLPEQMSVEMIAACSAVQLFSERASAAVPGFSLNGANARFVAEICRALDGLPLAIELAVSHLRGVRVEELAARIESVIRSRAVHLRGLAPRHQSLHALVQWSVQHLNQQERELFAALGVFTGGCTVHTAAGVATGDEWRGVDLGSLLSGLAERSLLVADTSAPATRYRMLETTRQHAVEMSTAAEREMLRSLHAMAIARMMSEAAGKWATTPTREWLATYASEKDNVRSALEWCFGTGNDPGLGAQLAGDAVRLWDELTMPLERERWFAVALERLPEGVAATLEGRLWLGMTSRSSHGDKTSLAPARRAAALFEASKDDAGLGEALHRCGGALLTPQATDEALAIFEQAERVLRSLGPTKMLANYLRSKSLAHGFAGDPTTARRILSESLSTARAVGDDRAEISASIAQAELEFAVGHAEVAIDIASEILADDRINLRQRSLVEGNLATYCFAHGDRGVAAAAARSSLRSARVLGWAAGACRALEYLALFHAQEGGSVTAARLLGYTAAFYARGGANREHTERYCYEMLCSRLEAMLDLDRIEALMIDGASLSLERAIDVASREPSSIPQRLGDTGA